MPLLHQMVPYVQNFGLKKVINILTTLISAGVSSWLSKQCRDFYELRQTEFFL